MTAWQKVCAAGTVLLGGAAGCLVFRALYDASPGRHDVLALALDVVEFACVCAALRLLVIAGKEGS